MQKRLEVTAPFEYKLSAENDALDFSLRGLARKTSSREITWNLDFDARSTSTDVIGGGIEFKFDLSRFSEEMGEPRILAGKRGWSWGRNQPNRIEMHFEPSPAAIYFERGNKSQLRVFFYNQTVPEGMLRTRVTLSLSAGMIIRPTVPERYGLLGSESWPPDPHSSSKAPVDISFLNSEEKPAGKRGFVKAEDDRLVFADGTPARFWGTNLTASALFGTKDAQICKQAKRLSALGFNLVRLHHHDSHWVNPNVFEEGAHDGGSEKLNKNSLARLDRWISCLKDEGIYVWLDLHVQRAFRKNDPIDGFEEIRKGKDKAGLKGYNYVNRSIVLAMKRFNEAYITHVNPYTGLAYKDEPAIAAMLITNENDITHHFGNALLPDKNVPKHNGLYMKAASDFAQTQGLPKNEVWRSWEQGASKLFLNDLEHRFNTEMLQQLRSLGVKVPIVTTNTWGGNPLSSLPSLTDGDIVDVHAYGDNHTLETNPLLAANLVDWLSAGQVVGKPMSVTEWNVSPFPAPSRHALPMYIAGSAVHQGWDAIMLYAYSQEPFGQWEKPSNWHAYNDPSLLATLPAAALLYRQGHVKAARTTHVFTPSREQFFYTGINPANSPALRTARETGKLLIAMPPTKELPWLTRAPTPEGATTFSDPSRPLVAVDSVEIRSDTGELVRNWELGIYTINTPRSQAAMGWIGGRNIKLEDVEFRILTKSATVAVQSLDGSAIKKSRNLMISLGTVAKPGKGNSVPYLVQPIEGTLKIRAATGLSLYRIRDNQKRKKVAVKYADGSYLINLDESMQSHWLLLREPG